MPHLFEMIDRDDPWFEAKVRDMDRCPDCEEFIFLHYEPDTKLTHVRHKGKVEHVPQFWHSARKNRDQVDMVPDAVGKIHGKPHKNPHIPTGVGNNG